MRLSRRQGSSHLHIVHFDAYFESGSIVASPFSFFFCLILFLFPYWEWYLSFFLFQQGIGSRQFVSLQGSRWIHNYIKGIKEGRSRQ